MEQSEVNNKREIYRRYIEEHQSLVKKAYLKFEKINEKINLLNEEERKCLNNDINHHDDSKFDVEEFEGYRIHYFPCSYENPNEFQELYLRAKKHHYENNDHHPQNPSRRNGLNKIACIHNILDWIGMSYKFKDDVWAFYNNSNIKQYLNPKEKNYIEEILEQFKEYKDVIYKVEIDR